MSKEYDFGADFANLEQAARDYERSGEIAVAQLIRRAARNQQAEIERLRAENAGLKTALDQSDATALDRLRKLRAANQENDGLKRRVDELHEAQAALLARLAKLEAALAFYRHPHWDGWNYISPDDGSAAADTLKGEE